MVVFCEQIKLKNKVAFFNRKQMANVHMLLCHIAGSCRS